MGDHKGRPYHYPIIFLNTNRAACETQERLDLHSTPSVERAIEKSLILVSQRDNIAP
jgi:hypothetical protein